MSSLRSVRAGFMCIKFRIQILVACLLLAASALYYLKSTAVQGMLTATIKKERLPDVVIVGVKKSGTQTLGKRLL